jgi:hypothetical protein
MLRTADRQKPRTPGASYGLSFDVSFRKDPTRPDALGGYRTSMAANLGFLFCRVNLGTAEFTTNLQTLLWPRRLPHRFVVVRSLELRAKGSPFAMLNGQVHLAQPLSQKA